MTTLRFPAWALLGLSALAFSASTFAPLQAAEPEEDLGQYFGFLPLEIFKLEERSANMVAGDLNHDGLTDLLLVDNSHSRLDLLLQRKERPKNAAGDNKVNEFSNDWRFDHKKISVDKAVISLTLGDFNGDGRVDIAYLGAPEQLIIRLQTENGVWKQDKSLRIPDVQTSQWSLAAGDLNHDGKEDLAVLGKSDTYLLYQRDGQLGTPERLMNTSDQLGLLQIGDLDGDGRADLCYLADDDSGKALCTRLQSSTGRIGPEFRFELEKPRGTSLKNIDGQPGLEILSINGQTGRLKLVQVRRPEAKTGELASQLVQYGLGGTGAGNRDRDLAIGDVTGDGRTDVVITDPDGAQLVVYQQFAGTGLDQGHTFPSLFGASSIRIADFDGDKQNELIVLSTREKTVGLSRQEEERLSFPQPLPIHKSGEDPAKREPVAISTADLDGNQQPEVVYIVRERTSSKSNYYLRALRLDKTSGKDWEWQALNFGNATEIPLGLKTDPERLVPFDANGDKRVDFLVFQGNDRPVLFLMGQEQGGLQEVAAEGGFSLTGLSSSNVFVQEGEQTGLLVAQHNFARQMRLSDKQQWQVLDQFTVAESNASLEGVAAINLDGQPGDEIVLVDSKIRKLRILRQEDQVYRPWKEVELGSFPFRRTEVADFNGDGLEDILLFGSNRFGILYANQTDPQINELANYETSLKEAFLADVIAGDLNGDGRVDLLLTETQKHRVEILDYSAAAGLRHALAFPIFEEKSFSERGSGRIEPREALIADVTNDGREDLILLAHDRILIYPQDPGEKAGPKTADK